MGKWQIFQETTSLLSKCGFFRAGEKAPGKKWELRLEILNTVVDKIIIAPPTKMSLSNTQNPSSI